MNKRQRSVVLVALVGAIGIVPGCGDDDAQPNPSFTTGGKSTSGAGSPGAGENGFGTGGDDTTPSTGGKGGTDNGAAGAPVTPQAGMSGVDPGTGGAGGASGVVEPPYDCVLNPKTHLEIINACTSAVRIEKHPVLPQIP